MADETLKVTEAAAAAEQVKAAPAAPAPKVKAAPEPEPEPAGPDRMTVKMANATNGARFPGEVLEVDAETGRALIQSGEATAV